MIAVYEENALFYVGKEIIAPGICSLLTNLDSTQFEIRIAESRRVVIEMQLIANYTEKDGTPYTTISEFLLAVPGLFNNTIANSDVQNPVAVDGDSVHAKDIDVDRCDMGNFSGDCIDFFNDLHSENVDNTATNPKLLTIHFHRTLITPLIGLGSSEGGSFSNVKVIGIVSGGIETVLADFSDDNTNRTSQAFGFGNVGLNAFRLEFHTTDTISLTNIFIPKMLVVASIPETPVKYATAYKSPYLLNGASDEMAVKGDVTPVDFTYTVGGFARSKWNRSFIDLQDGNAAFNPDNFGAILGPLANGVEIIVDKDGVETIMETWKTNMDISMTMYDFTAPYRAGSYIGRWTITSDLGSPISLFPGDKIICRINDDLTDLDTFRLRTKQSQ